ncbi:MAG: phosphocholine cytidylyltransferase family protein [Planctomycetes bacterium]|nr:phosphocholine cytidylyltransferase family protein [Planctomycetota bacterium]
MTERTLVILAAGRGTRLEPLTAERPKCLAPLRGRPLIEWQLEAIAACGVERVVLATGYRAEALAYLGREAVANPAWAETNMVESLWCAREACRGEVVVSYGDIVYAPEVLRALLDAPAEAAVAVDLAWEPYWRARFADPLADAETLVADHGWRLRALGQRPTDLSQVQAQYLGLTRWSPAAWRRLLDTYEAARAGRTPNTWPRPPRRWYVTDLVQSLIDGGLAVQGVPVRGGWLEVDTADDLALAERATTARGGRLAIERERVHGEERR